MQDAQVDSPSPLPAISAFESMLILWGYDGCNLIHWDILGAELNPGDSLDWVGLLRVGSTVYRWLGQPVLDRSRGNLVLRGCKMMQNVKA